MSSSSNVLNRHNWAAGNHRRYSGRPIYDGLDPIDQAAANEGQARRRSLRSTASGVSHSALGKRRSRR